MRLFRKLSNVKKLFLKIMIGKDRYSYVTDFKDGYALAITKARFDTGYGNLVIINNGYQQVADTQYFYCYPGQEVIKWLNGYTIMHDSNSAYIFDKNLQIKEGYQYEDIHFNKNDGNEWIEIVKKDKFNTEKKGILDNNLKTILETEFNNVRYLGNNEVAGVSDDSTIIYNLQNHMKKKVEGEVVDTTIYDNKKYYKFKKNGKYGYYDEKFKIVIVADNDTLDGINKNGNIAFMENGRSGIINIETRKKKFW